MSTKNEKIEKFLVTEQNTLQNLIKGLLLGNFGIVNENFSLIPVNDKLKIDIGMINIDDDVYFYVNFGHQKFTLIEYLVFHPTHIYENFKLFYQGNFSEHLKQVKPDTIKDMNIDLNEENLSYVEN